MKTGTGGDNPFEDGEGESDSAEEAESEPSPESAEQDEEETEVSAVETASQSTGGDVASASAAPNAPPAEEPTAAEVSQATEVGSLDPSDMFTMSGEEAQLLADECTPSDYTKAYPWGVGRETITSGRPKSVMFEVQEAITDLESECRKDVDDLIGTEIKKTDFREAALVVAYNNPELIAHVLAGWKAHDY